MKFKTVALVLFSSLLFPGVLTAADSTPAPDSKVVLSDIYKIDRKFKSMEGPSSTQRVKLLNDSVPQLVWVTGFRTDMVGADGKSESRPQFMCHVNLDFDSAAHARLFGWSKSVNQRLLTLSQGQINVKFPQGYGLPVLSDESFSLTTQVLNLNIEKPNFQVRHKVTFDFVKDSDASTSMKPLFNASVFGMKLLPASDEHAGMPAMEHMGQTCLPGATAPNAAGGSTYGDSSGQKFTGHWVVKPGRETNRTNVTKQLNLPFDTTLHYVAVHLHPFSESLELRDLTTNKSLFRSKVSNLKSEIGLSHVDSFSSEEGIPMYKDHQYELVSVYNNTTRADQDSMAVMLLFLLDKEFKKPDIEKIRAASTSAGPAAAVPAPVLPTPVRADITVELAHKDNPRLTLDTSLGAMTFVLFPNVAPKTVAHIMELARAGALDSTHFYRLEKNFVLQTSLAADRTLPMTASQRALLHPVPLEPSTLKHQRGVLSMAREDADPNSGDSSYSILLNDAPHLDGKYTIFGAMVHGQDVLRKIEALPVDGTKPATRFEVRKAEISNQK